MLLSERSQELTAALDDRREAPDEMLPHQGAIVCAGCTEVVRRFHGGAPLPRPYAGRWYNRVWELHTEVRLLLSRSP
jgi:hypothetical protein